MGRLRIVSAAAALALAAPALVTCGGNAAFDRLSAEEQSLWERCFEAMYPAMCGQSRDVVYRAMCGRQHGDRYADLPDLDARRRWVIARGCPPSMASPGDYVATSGGERAAVGQPPQQCRLPASEVRVCESSRGYRFAVPMTTRCATGARFVGQAGLTCSALERPAYHACLDNAGAWFPLRAWESCESFGYVDARGDFVPPGRRPELGVIPDEALPPEDRSMPPAVDAGAPDVPALPDTPAPADAAPEPPPASVPGEVDAGSSRHRRHRHR